MIDTNQIRETIRAARRAQAAAAYIPRGAQVMALGEEAWALAPHLKFNQLIRVERGRSAEGVVVSDFAAGELPQVEWDVAVILGRLERCPDVPLLLRRLRARGRPVVISYVPAEKGPADRAALGWVNAYTLPELSQLVGETGFQRA